MLISGLRRGERPCMGSQWCTERAPALVADSVTPSQIHPASFPKNLQQEEMEELYSCPAQPGCGLVLPLACGGARP